MNGDLLVERGALRLQRLADKAAARGDGVGTWLSEELRNDASFLRKLKPSLVKARAKGETPPRSGGVTTIDTEAAMAEPPTSGASTRQEPAAPPPPTPPRPAAFKPKEKKKAKRGGPPPIAIVGAAFVAGIVIAKVIDWRGRADSGD